MAIPISAIRSSATRYDMTLRTRNLAEAKRSGRQTAFLSHSHHDRVLAKGLQILLKDVGWDVYIDWEDATMPSTPNRETAAKIKTRILQTDWFLFLATGNSAVSRWCPWEIGYADGRKHIDSILIIPTKENGKFYGNEYLELYRRIDVTDEDSLAAFQPQRHRGPLVSSLSPPT